MELRWILVIVSLLIVAALAWHTSKVSPGRFFKKFIKKTRRLKPIDYDLDDIDGVPENEAPVVQAYSDILCIHIRAREGHSFGGERLLIKLNQVGLCLGDMGIFHYEHQESGKKYTLFSLASAYKPGTFDIDRMEDFKTPALSLFMQTDQVKNIRHVFETMVSTAQSLADGLSGELCDEHWQPLTDMNLSQYYTHINNLDQLRAERPYQ